MIVNFPLIAYFLVLLTDGPREPEILGRLRDRLPQVFQNDWDAVRKLYRIISSLSTSHRTFANTFTAGYTCNYTSMAVYPAGIMSLAYERLSVDGDLALLCNAYSKEARPGCLQYCFGC